MAGAPRAVSPEFVARVEKSREKRAAVRRLVGAGRWQDAEEEPERVRQFNARHLARLGSRGPESIIGDSSDYQMASFLPEGSQVRRAVAYVEVNDVRSSEAGSGFLISPRLFLTNWHVIRDANAARGTLVTFDRESDEFGRPRPTTSFLLDPDAFALFSEQEDLDYALVAIGERNNGTATLPELGYCPLSNSGDRHRVGMNVNIIQHPGGWPKMITIRNNLLTHRTGRSLLYETDTQQGSSGSPVFNDDWDVIALHHWGGPFLEKTDEAGNPISANVNEGVRISAIVNDLALRANELREPRQRQLLDDALALATAAAPQPGRHVLSPPRAGSTSPESLTLDTFAGDLTMSDSNGTELRVTIPIEVTIRIPGLAAGGSIVARTGGVATSTPVRTLTRGAESVQIDENYANRSGYKANFIPGMQISLPDANATLAKQIAPLRTGEDNAASGELKYEHFTVVLNKRRRIAMYTATNIDGKRYLEVDRKTGEVANDSEGEKWFLDTRVSDAYFLGQSFYSDWSDYFDRGHLTRRSDPTWGTPAQAERANADTYHFTNCSPQHWRFNESTRFWQGAERYVLEKGLLAADSGRKISVFQGPIFDDTIDQWADDVQIPSSFFKVIAWKADSGLKSVGLVVDQLALLDEPRKGMKPPSAAASVNVNQWRVGVAQIAKRTGLDFGAAVTHADTIAEGAAPVVGGEASRLIRRIEDILG